MGGWTAEDEVFLGRAFELAERGRGGTEPNPRVGCVLVAGGRVIGEGWHRRAGEAHAEVRALEAVRSGDRAAVRECTAYVTLEPCSHQGRTPPCADRLVAEGVGRVVVGRRDVDSRVDGRGLERLRTAGVEVVVAPEMSEIALQLRRFEVPRREGRPYIVLKWAQSSDGFVDARTAGEAEAGSGGTPISAARSRLLSHAWRTWEDGIVIGGRTALVDVPQLDARAAAGRSPRPVVLGRPLPAGHPLAARAFLLDPDTSLPAALARLAAEHGLSSLLVEGGPTTHGKFLAAGVWDEIRILESPHALGRGLRAPAIPQDAEPADPAVAPILRVGEDRVLTYFRRADAPTEPAA